MKSASIVALIIVFACNGVPSFPEIHKFPVHSQNFTGNVTFQKLTSTAGFKILLKNQAGEIADQTIFKYAPYRFDTADINLDGSTEIIVGLSKATRFDPVIKKRLFILRIDNDKIRPLWLGSKVCQELVDFKALENGQLQTLERTPSGQYSIGKYYWQSFGLTLKEYSYNEISLYDAKQLF